MTYAFVDELTGRTEGGYTRYRDCQQSGLTQTKYHRSINIITGNSIQMLIPNIQKIRTYCKSVMKKKCGIINDIVDWRYQRGIITARGMGLTTCSLIQIANLYADKSLL